MRRLFAVLLCLSSVFAASNAFAGRIFGDIKIDGKPLPAGVPVEIAVLKEGAKGKPPRADSTATDKFGAYKLAVKEKGKCQLSIVYEKQPLSLEVFSYNEPTRYDLLIEKKEGKLTLRRK